MPINVMFNVKRLLLRNFVVSPPVSTDVPPQKLNRLQHKMSEDTDEWLRYAASRGLLADVKAYLGAGADINAKNGVRSCVDPLHGFNHLQLHISAHRWTQLP